MSLPVPPYIIAKLTKLVELVDDPEVGRQLDNIKDAGAREVLDDVLNTVDCVCVDLLSRYDTENTWER